MRGYFFGHFMLSSIQQGIQAQHCNAEMFVNYRHESPEHDVLFEWALAHKTSILLNGGNCQDLLNLVLELQPIAHELQLPCTTFSEDNSLAGAMTCVSIVVPERIYNAASHIRDPAWFSVTIDYLDQKVVCFQNSTTLDTYNISSPQYALACILNRYSLAK